MKKMLPVFAVLGLVSANAQSAWQMSVSFPGYAGRAETLHNFPALVAFTPNVGNSGFDFKAHAFADPDGYDLRFTDKSGNPLEYEIDTHEPGVELLAWVKLLELEPDGSTFVIASWGDPGAKQLPCTTNGAVWADGFIFVQHYSGTGSLAALTADASQKYTGTFTFDSTGAFPSTSAGKIGRAVDFKTSTPHKGFGVNMPELLGAPWTIQSWFKDMRDNSVSNDYGALARGSWECHILVNNNAQYQLGTYSRALGNFNQAEKSPSEKTTIPMPFEGWRHLAASSDKSTISYYLDGEWIGDAAAIVETTLFGINANNNTGQKFADYLDEFRVATLHRSSNWIWAAYMSENRDPAFTKYAPPAGLFLRVERSYPGVGVADPAFGMHWDFPAGTNFTASLTEPAWTNLADTTRAWATGWATSADDGNLVFTNAASGVGTEFEFAMPGISAQILWKFTVSNLLEAAVGPGGLDVSGAGWCGSEYELELTANADSGFEFYMWTGDVPEGRAYDNPLMLPGDRPRKATAWFVAANDTGGQDTQYVATDGNDASNGLSFASAKLTIQAAVDALAPNGGLVLVAPGEYGVFAEVAITNAVTVRGVARDPAETVVFRVATAGYTRVFNISHADARIEFLTVRNGYFYGAVQGGNIYLTAGTVADCVVQNGHIQGWAASGGNIYLAGPDALVLRCVVTNGRLDGSGNVWGGGGGGIFMVNGRVEQCLVAHNTTEDTGYGSGVRVYGGLLMNSTIVRNGNVSGAVQADSGWVYNCVIVDNYGPNNTVENGGSVFGNQSLSPTQITNQRARFFNCVTDVYVNETCFSDPGQFAFRDAEKNNYRLTPPSIARDNGVTNTTEAVLVSETDLDGNPRIVNDIVDIGCYEYQPGGAMDFSFGAAPRHRTVPFDVVFHAAVANEKGAVTYTWDFGDGSPLLVTDAACVTNRYETPGIYTVKAMADDGFSTAGKTNENYITAVPALIRVRDGNQVPEFPHATWDTALKDLDAAVALAADGTTLLLSNGTYTVAGMVDLDAGITLRGLTGNPLDVRIRRPGAMAVRLNHSDARIESLTVRDSAFNLYINVAGGTASNCVLTAGAAPDWTPNAGGATLLNGLVTHCVITNNTHRGSHGHIAAGVNVSGGSLENCLVAGNTVTRSVGSFNGASAGGVVALGGRVVHCTIASNASRKHVGETGIVAGGPWGIGGVIATYGRVVNTLVAGNLCDDMEDFPASRAWGGNADCYENCLMDAAPPPDGAWLEAVAPDIFKDFGAANYRLKTGSPAVNAGPRANPAELPAVDLDGNPRLIGSRADLGCYEHPFLPGTLLLVR